MQLIAYRPEYRIYVDAALNMLLYERLEEMTFAKRLPHFSQDWTRALERLQPGFTVLCDDRRTLGPNTELLPVFLHAYELMLRAGIAIMAEVYPPGPTRMPVSRRLGQLSPLPTRQFTDFAAAENFLLGYSAGLAQRGSYA